MKISKLFFCAFFCTIGLFATAQDKPVFDIGASAGIVIPIKNANTMYYNMLNPGNAFELTGSVQFKKIDFILAISRQQTGNLNNQKYLDLGIYDGINFLQSPFRSTFTASIRARIGMDLGKHFQISGFIGGGYGILSYSPFRIEAFKEVDLIENELVELNYRADELIENCLVTELGAELQYKLKSNLAAHFRYNQQLLFYQVAPSYYYNHAEPVRKKQLAPQHIFYLGLNYQFN